jgi:hypothetical protein
LSSPSRPNDTTAIDCQKDCQPEKSWWRSAPGDAKVRIVDTREIEPGHSQEASQRASEVVHEPTEEEPPGPAPGGTERPAAPESVSWWRRLFGA